MNNDAPGCILKGNLTEDRNCPENVETVLCFVWLVYETVLASFGCFVNIFIQKVHFCFKFELFSALPSWFALC